jgi:hypothetical protein
VFPLGELLWFFGTSILFQGITPEPLFRLLYQCYGSNTRAGCARASQLTEVGGIAYKCIHRSKNILAKNYVNFQAFKDMKVRQN